MQHWDVVILGAGPYGLSAASHLQAIRGLRTRVFGEPMSFWQCNMPAGMLLRSPWDATHIADPQGTLTLDAYVAARGNHLPAPIPLERFVDYGRWFQSQAAPGVDTRKIAKVEQNGNGFLLKTEDDEVLHSRRVVIAAGIAAFACRPPAFDGLPRHLASHSCDQCDLGRFSGKRVLVVGGGQSALEAAALLHESGADAEVAIRKPTVHWLGWKGRISRIKPLGRLLYSPRDVGPAGLSQLVARPDCFRKLPRGLQEWTDRRAIRPAGAGWLQNRVRDIKIRTGVHFESAVPVAGQLRLTSNDGTDETFDHVLLATGYRIDIAKYKFLSPQLLKGIDRAGGYPRLKPGLESSVPGLHFLGAPAAWSFGPVLRFVSGTHYAVQALTRRIAAAQ
jgi:cation diffusion facilitator CzcD-associated flavoprotein CzcO